MIEYRIGWQRSYKLIRDYHCPVAVLLHFKSLRNKHQDHLSESANIFIKVRHRDPRCFRERFTLSVSLCLVVVVAIPGDTSDVLRRAIIHSWIITGLVQLLLVVGFFWRLPFQPGRRFECVVPCDRIRYGMSNEHEEWDPLSARTSFFSCNHGFHINIFYLYLCRFFTFTYTVSRISHYGI